jgi:glycosyltransferase involved in cell wall biosynthesis
MKRVSSDRPVAGTLSALLGAEAASAVEGRGAPLPFVSVAVPTRNRAHLLASCLAGLVAQDYPSDSYEVIVVDDGSRDGTRGVVERIAARPELPLVRYLYRPHRGANAARNVALEMASGDPVCFTDDDTVVPPSWVSRLVAASSRHPTAGCLGGPVHLRLEGAPPRICGAEPLGETELDLGDESLEVRYVWGANLAVRRHAVQAVGMFQEDRIGGHDEVEWIDRLFRAHIPVRYVPDAPVWHRRTAEDLRFVRMLRRRFVRGVGQAVSYHRAGFTYGIRGPLQSMTNQLYHALAYRCAVGAFGAAQEAGRVVGLVPLLVNDRLRGSRRELLPPPA